MSTCRVASKIKSDPSTGDLIADVMKMFFERLHKAQVQSIAAVGVLNGVNGVALLRAQEGCYDAKMRGVRHCCRAADLGNVLSQSDHISPLSPSNLGCAYANTASYLPRLLQPSATQLDSNEMRVPPRK